MTLEAIEQRIAELKAQAATKLAEIEQLRATLLALDGALQDCEYWKTQLSEPEQFTPTIELTPEELALAPLPRIAGYEPSLAERKEAESNGAGNEAEGDQPGERAKANGHDRGVHHSDYKRPARGYSSRLGRYN